MDAVSIFTLENDHLAVKVNALGAELCSVYSKPHALEYMWQGDKSVWPRHAPVLFPVVGKLRNNTYTYQDQVYNLSQHGFARDAYFNCTQQAQDYLTCELTSDDSTLQIFPFQFKLQINYRLQKDQLIVSYHVANPASTDLYFSIGAHPGFNCPLQADERFEDYRLEFPNRDFITCSRLADGLLTGETYKLQLKDHTLDVSQALFANDALVLENRQANEISLVSKKSGHGVAMQCEGWPYFGTWSKKGAGRFVCLEPWHGIADNTEAKGDITLKKGIIHLATRQEFSCEYSIRFF